MSKKNATILLVLLIALAVVGWYAVSRDEKGPSEESEAVSTPVTTPSDSEPSALATSTKASAITPVPGREGELGIWGNLASVSASAVSVSNGEEKLDCAYSSDTSFVTLSYGAPEPQAGDVLIVAYAEDKSIASVVDRRGVSLDALRAAGDPPKNIVVGEVTSVSGSKLTLKDFSDKARFIDLSGIKSSVLQVSGKPDVLKQGIRADLSCRKVDGSWQAVTLSVYR